MKYGKNIQNNRLYFSFPTRAHVFMIRHCVEIEMAMKGFSKGLLIGGVIGDIFLLGMAYGKNKFFNDAYHLGFTVGELKGMKKAFDLMATVK